MGRQNQMGLAAAVLSLKMGCDYLRTEQHLGITSGLSDFRQEPSYAEWPAPVLLGRSSGSVRSSSSSVIRLVSWTVHVRICSILGHIRKGGIRELHGSDHVHRWGGAQRKELVLCKNMFDCRHVNLVVFLPAWKIDFLISLPSIEWKKEPAKTFGENQSLD